MEKSIFVSEYNKSNKTQNTNYINQTVKINYIDVLLENEVDVNVRIYNDCLCKRNDFRSEYYSKCSKCNGLSNIILNGHLLKCNECEDGYIRKKNCYICDNKGLFLNDEIIHLKLDKALLDTKEIILDYKNNKIKLMLDINDYDYVIKNGDVYYLEAINYYKSDYDNDKKIKIKTFNGDVYVKSKFKSKKEIVKLVNKGIDNKDFYFIFNNKINENKEKIYVNVIGNGYVLKQDLINKSVVTSLDYVSLNSNYIYLGNKDMIEFDDCIVCLNRLDSDKFFVKDNSVYYNLYLDKLDMNNDRKIIEINNEKIVINYKKNLDRVENVIINKIVIDKNNKKASLNVRVIPYFNKEYRISIKDNINKVFIDDYKYDDYRLVETYKSDIDLDESISIYREDEIYINNYLIKIKRV